MIGGRLKVEALGCLKRGAASEVDETGETNEGLSCLDESGSGRVGSKGLGVEGVDTSRRAPPSSDDKDCAVFIVEMIGERLKVESPSFLKEELLAS